MAGPLPNFLIIGMAKAGTTSLADWLRAHPEAFVSETKEVHFFDDEENWARGVDWYAAHFAGSDGARVVGEATPFYMYYPDAIARIAQVVPDARLIAILRDPVGRAFSNWCHVYYRQAKEPRPFPQLVADELAEDPALPPPGAGTHTSSLRYLTTGRYLDQLENVLGHFPRERLHVVLMEDLKRDPEGAYSEICRFLGIDDTVRPPSLGTASNVHFEFRPVRLWRFLVRHRVLTRMGRLGAFVALRVMRRDDVPRPRIDDDSRERLARYFAEPNAHLAAWLGRDELPWTKPSGPPTAGG